MEEIAKELGLEKDSAAFAAHANELRQKINAVFWDETDGFYYDRSEKPEN